MDQDQRRLRAIVVDDEAFIRQVLSRILDRLGIEVVAVADRGATVPALYEEHRPDVVIMDIAMPEVDGLTTLGRLREMDPAAVVVICTSFSSRKYLDEAQELGAAGFLNKPFDMGGIRSTLDQLFPGRLSSPVP